ncbi:unnamed protein product [Danaus chrysippus]|uniref:(African queen) hypothetical protein n=1 Tax=Danaus chrysippus TaxID=151541 RepID=A0A8J2W4S1_9NEOP|nr:unnamed protein product [Danaus chrysippus]
MQCSGSVFASTATASPSARRPGYRLPRESENSLGTFSPPGSSRALRPASRCTPATPRSPARSAPHAGGWRGGAATRCALEISLSFTRGY